MKDISQDIVKKIREAKISPEARWKLNWRSYLFWMLMTGMVILGSLFFSLMIFNLLDVDVEIFHYFGIIRFMRLVILTAPIFWILLSLSALVFGILAFRKTSRGYRHSTLFVASLAVLSISILGVAAHFFRMNDRLDQEMNRAFPEFKRIAGSGSREGHWMRPDDGLIMGEIMEIGDGEFTLKNPRNEIWEVFYSKETKMDRNLKLEKGTLVGVIGKKMEDFVMEALAIRSFPKDRGREVSDERFYPPIHGLEN